MSSGPLALFVSSASSIDLILETEKSILKSESFWKSNSSYEIELEDSENCLRKCSLNSLALAMGSEATIAPLETTSGILVDLVVDFKYDQNFLVSIFRFSTSRFARIFNSISDLKFPRAALNLISDTTV